MKVILNKDIPALGTTGEIVNVKTGFARNYLFPRRLAVLASERNKAMVQHTLRILEKKKALELAEAKKLAALVEKASVTVAKQVGEGDKIFGSVTTAEVEAILASEGIKIEKKDISFDEDIKKTGVYTATVRLHTEVKAQVKVWVVAQ